jgi:BirA family transcriptional regulator, biotin operon repressor / biotin---[acetyl-CoA-carboxylase] ligase
MKNWTYKNFAIHEFDSLESTNSSAFEMAAAKRISHGEIILARQQISGKGRQNRNWVSPQGNLYFSIMLQPKIAAEKISQLSFVAIVALRLAVEKITKNSVKNKWPNDLLLDEKKISGLLLESKISGKDCEFVILGIGVNIESNPDNTIFPAGNLDGIISADLMLKNFLDEFEKISQIWYDFGFLKIRKLWLEGAYKLKEKISVKLDQESLEGVFEDLDEEGNLVLNCEGKFLKISVGDVS